MWEFCSLGSCWGFKSHITGSPPILVPFPFSNFSIFLYSTLKFNPVHIPGFHGGMLGGPAAHLIYHIFLPFTGPVSSLIGYAGWDPSAWVGGQKDGRYLLRGEALSCVALSWFELLQGLPSCRAPSAGRGMACSASS